jgi:hypothetical protein
VGSVVLRAAESFLLQCCQPRQLEEEPGRLLKLETLPETFPELSSKLSRNSPRNTPATLLKLSYKLGWLPGDLRGIFTLASYT